jgi:hypothetical protein
MSRRLLVDDVAPFTIVGDASAVEAALAQLTKLAESFPHIVNELFEGTFDFSELVCFDVDRASTFGTANLRVVFKPAPFLLGFMAAVRAFDRQREIVK